MNARLRMYKYCYSNEGAIYAKGLFVWVIIRFRVQFGINLHELVFQKAEIARVASASAISAFWKTYKCKWISNWTRKTAWLLINNTNMKKCVRKKCRKMFRETIFSHLRKFFSEFPSVQTFCQWFTWYHWPTNFFIVFLPIIIQKHDVLFALVLHFSHRCYTFCTGVTLEPHCSQPIRIE